ncbi:unnamed protein product, partial [Prorocentrum cordatum]
PASTWRDRTPEQTLRLRLASVPGARASRKLGSAARQWPDGRATPPGLSTKGRAPQVEGEAKKPLLFQYSAKPQEVVRSSLLRLCRSCACVAGGVALGAPGPARHAPAGGEQLGAGEEEEEEEEEEGARTSEKGCAALALEILHGGRRAPSPARCPALVTSTTELCWAHVVWSHRPAVRKAALVLQADVGTKWSVPRRDLKG